METFYQVLKVLGTIGLVVFCFSVADSLEKIAKSLRRLADAREKDGEQPGGKV